MSERLTLDAMAKLDGIIEDRISRENRQLGFIPDAEIDFLQEHADHLVQVSYDGSFVRGFGCKSDSPPEIASRVERIIADSVKAMIAAGHQPAILPRATADALANMGIGATGTNQEVDCPPMTSCSRRTGRPGSTMSDVGPLIRTIGASCLRPNVGT